MKYKWFLGEVSIGYKRTATQTPPLVNAVRNSNDSANLFRKIMAPECMEHHEEMWLAYLNNANKVIGYTQLSKGNTTATIVNIKELVQGALMCNAVSVLMMHNHPSGATKPSNEDVELTRKVRNALDLFDIRLLDHIILTTDTHVSLLEEGII
jgi:DNA repair protein RadC